MTESEVRHGRAPSTRWRRVRIAAIALGSILVLIVAAAGAFVLSLSSTIDNVDKIEQAFPEESLRPPTAEPVDDNPVAQNILLLGSDTRGSIGNDLSDTEGTRSDTMMIVHIPADRESVQVMSLMRDFWVEIPGHGSAKLNAAMSYGGVPLAVQTIEGIIDSRIDHVMMVDFEGFKGVTDALGGVTINNPTAFTTGSNSYAQGEIELNGEQALPFVRERYSFVDGDYTRVANQQLFIKAVMAKVLSKDTLTSPAKISNLVSALAPYVAVDNEFDSRYAASLGFELNEVRVSDVNFFTMPTLGTGTQGDQSVVNVNWDEVPKIQQAFKNDLLGEYVPPPE
ncbi:LCP family protein [Salinibacterium sp. SWN1162]|uniref:LCP family protein n=1 Tax=Salinibacterium sp. SWN1162 TaxID=2792053 RepID=UPI0018CE77FE|nr:LCP family protein [Salinibacterium sp. SWN1162]MBH0008122.1 LCP family protein [Salinibacterium sp. SWN1162]